MPAPALGLDPAKVAELQAKRESIRALWRGAKTLAGAEAEGLENASTVVAEDNDDVVEPTAAGTSRKREFTNQEILNLIYGNDGNCTKAAEDLHHLVLDT